MSRAAAASPQLESGNWYLPHPILMRWVDGFIAECAAFPTGANDDQVDAWSQGALRLLHHRAKHAPSRFNLPDRYLGDRAWMI
jgi:predicted phage terminase large subunit-like protein